MRVGVFGGGAVGLAAALILVEQGLAVTLYDANGFETEPPTGESDPRVWALNPSAIALLEGLGCSLNGSRQARYHRMRVVDAGSDAAIQFGPNALGVIVEADWVRSALIARARRTKQLDLVTADVETLTMTAEQIHVDGLDAVLDAAILAEGRRAHLAQSIGLQRIVTAKGHHALVGTLASARAHGSEAYQIFTAEGPLALLPLPDQGTHHRVSLVWSMSDGDADRLSALSDDELVARVTAASEGARGGLAWVGPPVWIPISQHHLDRDAIGPCLAIGDTAHGIFPLAGLGANLGFADVLAMRSQLAKTRVFQPARFARSVERERRVHHVVVAEVMATLQWGFASTDPLVRLGRSAAFRFADRCALVKSIVQQRVG